MARVFLAELQGPSGFRKRVAIKIVRSAIAANNDQLTRSLVNEARLGGLLHHPNVVETYEFGEVEGLPFIAMELVRGFGLDELLASGAPLSPQLVVEIGAQICCGLDHAHNLGHADVQTELVHRDLKPSNILISLDGLVKVMDFGIAKAAALSTSLTQTGMTKGTPAYMSPEQVEGEPLDRRSDLFAVGAVLYELALGKRVFSGDSLMTVLASILRVEERLKEGRDVEEMESVVPGLSTIVQRCLRREREERYPTAATIETDLRSLQQRLAPGRGLKSFVSDFLASMEEPTVDGALDSSSGIVEPTLLTPHPDVGAGRVAEGPSDEVGATVTQEGYGAAKASPPEKSSLPEDTGPTPHGRIPGGPPRPVAPTIPQTDATPTPPIVNTPVDGISAVVSTQQHTKTDQHVGDHSSAASSSATRSRSSGSSNLKWVLLAALLSIMLLGCGGMILWLLIGDGSIATETQSADPLPELKRASGRGGDEAKQSEPRVLQPPAGTVRESVGGDERAAGSREQPTQSTRHAEPSVENPHADSRAVEGADAAQDGERMAMKRPGSAHHPALSRPAPVRAGTPFGTDGSNAENVTGAGPSGIDIPSVDSLMQQIENEVSMGFSDSASNNALRDSMRSVTPTRPDTGQSGPRVVRVASSTSNVNAAGAVVHFQATVTGARSPAVTLHYKSPADGWRKQTMNCDSSGECNAVTRFDQSTNGQVTFYVVAIGADSSGVERSSKSKQSHISL